MFCLLVESNPSAGLALAEMLDAYGHFIAGPFTSVKEACRWLERFTPDIAIVGTTSSGGPRRQLIRKLQTRDIPFLVHSAAEPSPKLLDNLPDIRKAGCPASAALVEEARSSGSLQVAHRKAE
jgi:hypothetical protein